MNEHPDGAILQRDKTTYAIVPRTPAGLITPSQLSALARAVEKHKIPIVKITSGQRIALVGMGKEAVQAIWDDLSMDIGRATELCLHYVQSCPGDSVCTFGLQDSLGFALELERAYEGLDLPAKVKMGVSGCPLCCGESYVRDVGLVGRKNGWEVSFGGNAGQRARIGDVLAADLPRAEARALVDRLLDFYRTEGRKRERTARFVARVGIEAVKAAVLPGAEDAT